jgi:hypothetical protein
MVIELWAVEAFCLMTVIACLFFVASVLSMLEMQAAKATKLGGPPRPKHVVRGKENKRELTY